MVKSILIYKYYCILSHLVITWTSGGLVMKLKELRESRKISQAELAKDFGVAQNTISQWENESRSLDKSTILKLANYFNVSTDYLLGNVETIDTPDIRFNDFRFALLHGENDLTSEQKEDLLDYYEFIKSKNKK